MCLNFCQNSAMTSIKPYIFLSICCSRTQDWKGSGVEKKSVVVIKPRIDSCQF